ncbi:MAG: serine/threonine protein kinase [Kofleriaceae bacterium]|nr:serine/threonine protein kinase [Kofleriaceae bacterium]
MPLDDDLAIAATAIGVGADDVRTGPGVAPTLLDGSGAGQISARQVGRGDAPVGAPARGDSIGRFVVLGLLGSGGMGLVYSAYDPHLDRKVAIKLLRTGALPGKASDARARLLREAQAMAKINHPNVITVHEVGTFGDEVYLAMEFADDGTLRGWMTSRHDLAETLAVFVQAGRGLAAAHDAGLVHRDFKPDNVLLTTAGGVRVTDFGIVGIAGEVAPGGDLGLDDRRSNDSPPGRDGPVSALSASASGLARSHPLSQPLTRTGSILGTPMYMAPEQFAGEPITARADQFAFCVTLYEALHGTRPFAGDSFEELRVAVLTGEQAPAPRNATVPAWLRRVLARGLATDPAARFPSMRELLAALDRDPARRHRRVLAAAALAAVAVAATGFVLAATRTSAQERCAAGAGEVDAVWSPTRARALTAAFARSSRPLAADSAARASAVLDGWRQRWRAGYVDACAATHTARTQSATLLDRRLACLGRGLGAARGTVDALLGGGDDAVDRALAAVTGLPMLGPCADADALLATVPAPREPLMRTAVASVRIELDEVRGLGQLGRLRPALARARTALAVAETTGYRPLLAEATLAVGDLEQDLALPTGPATLRRALHLATATGDPGVMAASAAAVLGAMANRGLPYPQALEVAELALAQAERTPPPPLEQTKLLVSVGLIHDGNGRATVAQEYYQRALAVARAGAHDHEAVFGSLLTQIGNNAKARGAFFEARTALEQALASDERVYGPGHPQLASSLNNLANVARAEGKFEQARAMSDRALAIRLAAYGPDHPEVGTSYLNLGVLAGEEGDDVAARAAYEKALAIWERAYGPDNPELFRPLNNLCILGTHADELEAAKAACERAVHVLEAGRGKDHVDLAGPLSGLANIADAQGRPDDAVALGRRAIALTEAAYGLDHPDLFDYLGNLASVLRTQGKLDEAEATMARAMAIAAKAYGPDDLRIGMGMNNLSGLQATRGRWGDALTSAQRALAIFTTQAGPQHPYASYAHLRVGSALASLGRPAEAAQHGERALAIRTAAGMPARARAETQFALAQWLHAARQDRRRVRSLLADAVATYRAEGDGENAAEVSAWARRARVR